MSSSKIKTHNLNVSDRYVPDWGPWEVVREIVTNAMDACSDWELTHHGDDHVTIFTSTAPRLGDILVIGQGSKELGGIDIGQFGEGLKLAALTCVRAGGTFLVKTSFGTIRFYLKELLEYEANVLHCDINTEDAAIDVGCYIDIIMMDVGTVSSGRFLKDKSGRKLKKSDKSHLNLYLKGVWISRTSEESLNDWNLVDSKINRDRNMVDRNDVRQEVCEMICDNMSVADAEELILTPDSFETDSMSHCYFPPIELKSLFRTAFRNIHGDKTVLSVSGNDRANEYAVLKGYNVVACPSHALERLLSTVKKSTDLVPSTVSAQLLHELEVPSIHPILRDIRRVLDRLHFPVELKVFRDSGKLPENYPGDVTGDGPTGIQIWIRQDILSSRRDTLEAVLMFVSSARNTHPGSSLAFEGSMVSICAAIAEAWLDDSSGLGIRGGL